MEEIEVKWSHAIQIWWSWCWRTMVIVSPLSFLVGVAAGIIMTILNIDIEKNTLPLQVIGLCIGFYFSIRVLKMILGKSFNGYRIALIKKDTVVEGDA